MNDVRQTIINFDLDTFAVIKKMLSAVSMANNRAILSNCEDILTFKDWYIILKQSNGYCYYCNKEVGYINLGIEHVIPLSKKGKNNTSNIVASCNRCNNSKLNRIIDVNCFSSRRRGKLKPKARPIEGARISLAHKQNYQKQHFLCNHTRH